MRRNKRDKWEREVPELTEEQQKAQNEILFNLGRDRRIQSGTNSITSSHTIGSWLYRDIRWELDSLDTVDYGSVDGTD